MPASSLASVSEFERQPRLLTPAERKVQRWARENYGILSRIAREIIPPVSVQFVHKIAYGRGEKSRGMRVERALLKAGCPLIQKIQ